MEVHILIPPNGKKGIEIRVVGMDDGQDVTVTEQKFYTAAAEKEKAEKKKQRSRFVSLVGMEKTILSASIVGKHFLIQEQAGKRGFVMRNADENGGKRTEIS